MASNRAGAASTDDADAFASLTQSPSRLVIPLSPRANTKHNLPSISEPRSESLSRADESDGAQQSATSLGSPATSDQMTVPDINASSMLMDFMARSSKFEPRLRRYARRKLSSTPSTSPVASAASPTSTRPVEPITAFTQIGGTSASPTPVTGGGPGAIARLFGSSATNLALPDGDHSEINSVETSATADEKRTSKDAERKKHPRHRAKGFSLVDVERALLSITPHWWKTKDKEATSEHGSPFDNDNDSKFDIDLSGVLDDSFGSFTGAAAPVPSATTAATTRMPTDKGSRKFLDYYSSHDMVHILEQSGIVSALADVGYDRPSLIFDTSDDMQHRMSLVDASLFESPSAGISDDNDAGWQSSMRSTDRFLIDLYMKRRSTWTAESMVAYQLMTRLMKAGGWDGLKELTGELRAPYVPVEGAHALLNFPFYWHLAVAYAARGWRHTDPAMEAYINWLTKQVEPYLQQHGLAFVAWAVSLGHLRRSVERHDNETSSWKVERDNLERWTPAEQLYPTSDSVKEFLYGPEWSGLFEQWTEIYDYNGGAHMPDDLTESPKLRARLYIDMETPKMPLQPPPTKLPGSFPHATTSSSSSSSASNTPRPTPAPSNLYKKSPKQAHRELDVANGSSSSGSGSGRGRRVSASVQSRRSAVSLGLGVSFAPMDLNPPSSTASSTERPPSAPRSGSASPDQPVSVRRLSSTSPRSTSPRPISPSELSSTHSRRSSMSNTSPLSASLSVPSPQQVSATQTSATGGTTRSASRNPSRRPSLSHLASFLNGVEHHARVRYPGASGGRGVSRSASRSQSRVGQDRTTTPGLGSAVAVLNQHRRARRRRHGSVRSGDATTTDDGTDEYDDEDDDESESEVEADVIGGGGSGSGSGSGSRTASRASSRIARSRRSSVSVRSGAAAGGANDGSPHPALHELVRENTTGGRESVAWEFMDEVDSALATTNRGAFGSSSSLFSDYGQGAGIESGQGGSASNVWTAAWRNFVSPRLPTIDKTGEEPFLESAPQSPVPRRTRTTDSGIVEGGIGALEEVEIFQEGERIGVDVWLEGRGGWVRDCFADAKEGSGPGNGIGGPRELEVERRLGEGTYAIVYLVREVLYDPDFAAEDMLSPIDAVTSFQFDSSLSQSHRPRMHSWGSDPFSFQPTTYGRHFALKCLCKKDLTQDLIEVQRGEAVLHRSLPEHQYIVQLYGAYETDDWLFLVLEYCPGRDLFYWLLESRQGTSDAFDSQANSPTSPVRPLSSFSSDDEAQLSRTITASNPAPEMLGDETPPSPSLLASANTSLLSRKRLRLISRMFGQMCQAVQACHDVGISHRDIKPENFIVVENSQQHDGEGASSRIIVKITDWGLGTREERCEDFDCGSKPYMSYECRNNLAPSYDPRQADVWSLGLVLLNLLYHRNPWADPSLDDPDFSAYVKNQTGFLQERFDGMPDDVAIFLSENVFCDVLESVNGVPKRRVSAGELGRWASRLHLMMADDVTKRQRQITVDKNSTGASSTSAMASASSPFEVLSATPRASGAGPLASGSLLSQQFASGSSSSSLSGLSSSKPWSPTMLSDIPRVPSAIDEQDERTFIASSNAPFAFSDDESLPSPTFSPRMSPAKQPPSNAGNVSATVTSAEPKAVMLPWNVDDHDDEPTEERLPTAAASNATPSPIVIPPPFSDTAPLSPPGTEMSQSTEDAPTEDTSPLSGDEDNSPVADCKAVEGKDCEDSKEGGDDHSQKSKRRKRGARKSKSSRSHHGIEATMSVPTSPISPGSPSGLSTVEEGVSKDQLLEDLASASQNLARELSKVPPKSHRTSSHSRPPSSFGSHSTSALRSIATTDTATERKTGGGGGMFGRFKSLVTEGNPDLEAFKQRAAERNASIGAASAPAKIEGRRRTETPLSSRGSFGTSSWGSNWSYEGGDEDSRGRLTSGEMSPKHWSSTSNRRERIDKQRRRIESDFSPSSSTRNGTTSTTTDSHNNTPLSSFSSVNSNDVASSTGGASSRDWRRAESPRRQYGSRSRQVTGDSMHALVNGGKHHSHHGKPKLVDAAVDTNDLTAPSSPSSSIATIAPLPSNRHSTSSQPLTTIKSADSLVSATPTTTSLESASTAPVAPTPPPTKTKLAKMLNSISMFNRSQEKPMSSSMSSS
ncbi:hypothetical protein OIO90_006474 [Microbotryomycetes sp. JL221]|nr:hypothetical protein OIO90_006474 [Microbotryomycetes sp. JL221]